MKVYGLVLLILIVGLAGSAGAQESGDPARGLTVARELCGSCHAVRRGQEVSPNPVAPPFVRVANIPGMTAMALNHLMHSSHKTMPNIILAPEDQWHLVAYILSLQTR